MKKIIFTTALAAVFAAPVFAQDANKTTGKADKKTTTHKHHHKKDANAPTTTHATTKTK